MFGDLDWKNACLPLLWMQIPVSVTCIQCIPLQQQEACADFW